MANDTAMLLNFFDQNGQKTFGISRKYAPNEKAKVVLLIPPINSQVKSQQAVSNKQQSATSSNQQTSGQTSQSQAQSNPPTTQSSPPSVQNAANAGITLSEVKRLLVGIYNPTQVYTLKLPPVLTQNIQMIFTLNSLSISGLCFNYKYPVQVTEQNGVIQMTLDVNNRLSVRSKPGCDQA